MEKQSHAVWTRKKKWKRRIGGSIFLEVVEMEMEGGVVEEEAVAFEGGYEKTFCGG